MKRQSQLDLLLPTLTTVASLGRPLPLVWVYLRPSHVSFLAVYGEDGGGGSQVRTLVCNDPKQDMIANRIE